MPALTVEQVHGGVLVFRSELWATNSVLVPAGDACIVCDPSIFPDEIARVRASARTYERVFVLVTHSDFDHVCGLPAFADATVLAGATTARAIAVGAARRGLDEAGREWGASWDGTLCVDIVLEDRPVPCGTHSVTAIPAPGHCDDGAAFVIDERGLLLPGDYLSAVCHPIALGSISRALVSYERLLRALDEWDISTVVPGHGPVLDRGWAQRIGHEDLDYLRQLQIAATGAVRDGTDASEAVAQIRGIPPPRRARPDFEALDMRSCNARCALAEAGHPAFARADENARHTDM